MGLDLALLPFDADEGIHFSHTVLKCERRIELFEEIMKLPSTRVPENFTTLLRDDEYQETHYGNTQETPYGDPLTFMEVENLLRFSEHEGVQNHFKNRAIWAYLAYLPPRTKVALYWH